MTTTTTTNTAKSAYEAARKSALAKAGNNKALRELILAVNRAVRMNKITHEHACAILVGGNSHLVNAAVELSARGILGDYDENSRGAIITAKTSNLKLGLMTTVGFNMANCPTDCALKKTGICYTRYGNMRFVAHDASNPNDKRSKHSVVDFAMELSGAVLEQYGQVCIDKAKLPDDNRNKQLSPRVFIRYSVVGDMATTNTNELNAKMVDDVCLSNNKAKELLNIVDPNAKLHAYTYTHCKQTFKTDAIITKAYETSGLVINYSADTLDDVESAYRAKMPVIHATADVEETQKELAKRGINSKLCLAQDENSHCDNCRECGLCSVFNRKSVILFDIHGPKAPKAKQLLQEINFKAI